MSDSLENLSDLELGMLLTCTLKLKHKLKHKLKQSSEKPCSLDADIGGVAHASLVNDGGLYVAAASVMGAIVTKVAETPEDAVEDLSRMLIKRIGG